MDKNNIDLNSFLYTFDSKPKNNVDTCGVDYIVRGIRDMRVCSFINVFRQFILNLYIECYINKSVIFNYITNF